MESDCAQAAPSDGLRSCGYATVHIRYTAAHVPPGRLQQLPAQKPFLSASAERKVQRCCKSAYVQKHERSTQEERSEERQLALRFRSVRTANMRSEDIEKVCARAHRPTPTDIRRRFRRIARYTTRDAFESSTIREISREHTSEKHKRTNLSTMCLVQYLSSPSQGLGWRKSDARSNYPLRARTVSRCRRSY